MKSLGLISIGQSTDGDFVPVIRDIVGTDVRLDVRGALDGLTDEDIAAMAPRPGEHPVVTELSDGRSVRVSKPMLVPHLNRIMREMLESGTTLGCLMCTGSFEGLEAPEGFALLQGRQIIDHAVLAVCPPGAKLGVLVPLAEQEALSGGKYRDMGYDVVCGHGNPYGDMKELAENARVFRGCFAVVMHCMGYGREHRRVVAEASGALMLEANAVMGRMAGELLV